MDCNECGGTYQKRSDRLAVIDPYVGEISIQSIQYYLCDKCDDVLYTEKMALAIEKIRNNRIKELLRRYPIDDFISAAETAMRLGITRQALHKHRRINRGFIYQLEFGGATVYLAQSVQRFKKIRDGRFPLHYSGYIPVVRYDKKTVAVPFTSPYELQQGVSMTKKDNYIWESKGIKENAYAN